MAKFYNEPSRTFSEYLLIPSLTTKECVHENVDLSAPLVKGKPGEDVLRLNIPFTSSIMQSVSDATMGIALARSGDVVHLLFAGDRVAGGDGAQGEEVQGGLRHQ